MKLYHPVLVTEKIATMNALKKYNASKGIKDFDYSLVKGYLTDTPEEEEPCL